MKLKGVVSSGSWWLKSKLDPRWDCSGYSESIGGFEMPSECKDKVEELEKIFGNNPKDLEFGYTKN